MGYVHDTAMVQFIPPNAAAFTLGTWTPSCASQLVSLSKAAAAEIPGIIIPIPLPGNSANFKGSYLVSVDVIYSIGTLIANDLTTVELDKQALPATGSAQTGANVAFSFDSAHATAALRKALGSHTMTLTLTTPAWIGAGDAYFVYMLVDCQATTVLKYFGARAYFTKRL